MRDRKIRTNLDKISNPKVKFSGWFSGKGTYLRISMDDGWDRFLGCLSGQKLYRLAKAIVRHFENDGYMGTMGDK